MLAKRWLVIPVVVGLLAAGGSGGRLFGQETTPEASDEENDNDRLYQVVALDFPGGTVDEYVAMVHKAVPLEVTIVVTEAAAGIRIPKVKVHRANVLEAMDILRTATSNRVIPQQQHVQNDYVLVEANPEEAQTRMAVINMSSWLAYADDGHSEEVLLAAMQAGISMLGQSAPAPQIRLHKETGLLFVRGGNAEVALVEDIAKKLMAE